ncbi:hypothetical protein KKH23_07335 [Patescibacteria group bacterium]|uniref:Uncharacterized protein n=1 Tax=viral metagenome TaxID=1070528 RepID=A0A6M3X4H4_9ZZZZ|nr:hypothetical protein [Patescibacteria group bacterium]
MKLKFKKGDCVRQGDVLLEKVDDIPSNLKKHESRLLVAGEGRDHGHFIEGEDVEVLEAPSNSEFISHYLDVKKYATLEHNQISTGAPAKEHHTIPIPGNKYKVIRQHEFDPYEEMFRKVQD